MIRMTNTKSIEYSSNVMDYSYNQWKHDRIHVQDIIALCVYIEVDTDLQ